MASPLSGDPSPVGLPAPPVATLAPPSRASPEAGSQGPAPAPCSPPAAPPAHVVTCSLSLSGPAGPAGPPAPPEPPFPDIYGGDAQLWAAHFRGIGRAYRALGKEDDFAIRVLTEDFTLPFPFAWPPGPDPARGPLFYDPHDRVGFDFLLRGPGAPPPALLRPLHATAQAAMRKRRLERLALSYASAGAPRLLLAPGPGSGAAFPAPAGSDAATPGGAPRLA
ncbi:collagen alpha-1(XVII) chain [Meles meles]|uniref:collagen alpha-1(XVII) chain n=1 Tax=Meles meles TaxID=9662 RepID=UPI001E69E081|nr:collagen alpha-1(XVII) chain [Meles meles]